VIDLRAEKSNAFDSMRFSRESFSNKTDESDAQHQKHDEQRISTSRGIVINLIGWRLKELEPTRRSPSRKSHRTD
jgi:hypothetical protein